MLTNDTCFTCRHSGLLHYGEDGGCVRAGCTCKHMKATTLSSMKCPHDVPDRRLRAVFWPPDVGVSTEVLHLACCDRCVPVIRANFEIVLYACQLGVSYDEAVDYGIVVLLPDPRYVPLEVYT